MSVHRNKGSSWRHLTRGSPLAVLVIAGLLVLYNLLPVLELVAIAALIALVMRTTLEWLQRFVRVRWMAVLILVGLIGGLGIFIGLVMIPNLVAEAQTLSLALPHYVNSLIQLSRQLHSRLSFVPDLSQGLQQFRSWLYSIISFLPLLLRNIVDMSLQAVATLILAIYMAVDPNSLIKGMLRLAPYQQHRRIKKLLHSTKIRLEGWILGTGLAMLIVGSGAAIGLWFLQVPLPLSFGVIAGLLEVIPYFGSIVGTFLPALVALTISPVKMLLVLALFLVLNQIDAHIVQPLVMAKRVNLHPVVVIIAFLSLGKLLGFVGVLLAVPAAAVLMTLMENFTIQRREGSRYSDEQSEAFNGVMNRRKNLCHSHLRN